jgi:hypothetical protein
LTPDVSSTAHIYTQTIQNTENGTYVTIKTYILRHDISAEYCNKTIVLEDTHTLCLKEATEKHTREYKVKLSLYWSGQALTAPGG